MKLGDSIPKNEAIDEFGGTGAKAFCHDAFILCGPNVLCFFDHGSDPGQGQVVKSDALAWRPNEPDAEPTEPDKWFPEPIREAWNEERTQRVLTHHVFLRTGPTGPHTYLGVAHLSSFGGYPGQVSAQFTLTNPIPRHLWIEWTGFDGWIVNANHKDFDLEKQDTKGFNRLLNQTLKKRQSHLYLTRYEGDRLELYISKESAWLMYLRNPSDTGLYIKNQPEGEEETIFECACGIDLEIPTWQTVPKDLAAEIARSFFLTGKLPENVAWTTMSPP